MSDEFDDELETTDNSLYSDYTDDSAEATEGGFDSMLVDLNDPAVKHQLRGMYQSWYLDYASYTILDRAIPNIFDGLKPVQRRILHSMKNLDDGHFNKVANIVGDTMKFHPHGDASIYGALVQLGQKELLVDTQGNWGNILTGASAAAGRYIEARLSHFALEVLYSPKVTEWTPSYDGRDKEPVTLPAKFPLLLAQGVGGIAAGLSSLILPHNFNDILDAAIAYLQDKPFTLYPDFPTGGMIDISRYNDGGRGGRIRIRAKIEKIDSRTLAITEIPFGLTTSTLIDSILKAGEKGKIKIRKVDDNTAETAYIVVHLLPGTSSDKTIDALYAFTQCELPISPNCCVIDNNKPRFLGVSEVLRRSVDHTRDIFRAELEIQRHETSELLHAASLEKIFIEQRIYKDREFEQGENKAQVFGHIRKRLKPYESTFVRPVTDADLDRLLEIRMARILKYNSLQAEELMASYLDKMAKISDQLEHLTQYAIDWYRNLKKKYGAAYPRRTQIRSFEDINAATVADANERLYINREEGFIGTGLKKDEFLFNCSSIDDIIIFYRDGRFKVVKVSEKAFVGKNVLHVGIFKRDDSRTIYNVIYQDGKGGTYYMKRFNVGAITRDREYDLTRGTQHSRIVWFSANPNGEAETVRVTLKPRPRLKTLRIDVDFSTLAIKGRSAQGNIVTRLEVARFSLKEKGLSTLGGLKVWYDPDVQRLNYDGRGTLLGEFQAEDRILIIDTNGVVHTTGFELTTHFPDNVLRVEKYDPRTEWTAIFRDADHDGRLYIKRFTLDDSSKPRRIQGDNPESKLIALSDAPGARFRIIYGGHDSIRPSMEFTAYEYVGLRSLKAKGKPLTKYDWKKVEELEPVEISQPEVTSSISSDAGESTDIEDSANDNLSDDELLDELTGQQRIF